ncbi:MAG: GlsB/YeaQ/YmgE family stress response membrane protein [Acidobacteria bacterium]|nr:GlsB/YeaQ/YmgE family stress response membrane protein [Acidobacteriota bacterium]
MGILVTIILGGLAGWIASILLGRDAQQGILLNIVVGIVGAFLANLLVAPVFDTAARLDHVSVTGFIMAVLGACVLLAIVNLFTRGRVR